MADIPEGSFTHTLEDIDAATSQVESTQGEAASLTAAVTAIADTEAAEAAASAIGALNVLSVGGTGKYISAIKEENGIIVPTPTNLASAPASGGTAAISSGAVYTAIENAVSSAVSSAISSVYGVGTTKTATADNHFDLDDLKTIGRFNFGASIVQNGYVDNLPSDFPATSGGTIVVENNQLSTRYSQTLYVQNVTNAGTFWKRNFGSASGTTKWSAWYRFDGEEVQAASLNSINPAQLQSTPPDDDEMR